MTMTQEHSGTTPEPGSAAEPRGSSAGASTIPGGASKTPAGPDEAPARVAASGRHLTRSDLMVAAVIALGTMLVATLLRSALVPTDPWHYVQGALDFPNGTWRPAGLSRWGFVLPIIPFARLWGDAPATYYVIPLLSTGVLAAVVYLLGTRFAGRAAGGLGVALALGTPMVFVNLSRGYADLTATMLVGLAILLATVALDTVRDRGGRWGRRVPALLLASGFVTAWSFEVRETAILAWPVVALILWQLGSPRRAAKWFLPPMLAWAVLDLFLSWRIYGDPLLKLHIISGADISTSDVISDAGYVGHSRLWYAAVMVRSLMEVTGGLAILVTLGIGTVGGFVLRRQLGTLWAWGILSLLPLWLQGGVLSPAHPSVRLDVARYWVSFAVPLMLTAACVAVILLRRTTGRAQLATRITGGLLAVGLVVPSVGFMASYPGFVPNGGRALSELRAYLATTGGLPESRIFTDWGTRRLLPTYQASTFGGELLWEAGPIRSMNRFLKQPPLPERRFPHPGDYVVLYSQDDSTCWHCWRALNAVEKVYNPLPGEDWKPVFTSSTGNLTLYRLGPDAVWPKAAADSSPSRSGDPDGEESEGEEPGL